MLKTLLISSAVVGAGVIGAAAQSTMQGGAGADVSVSAATHCKDANGQARMKTAGNTAGAPTAGSSAGKSDGAGERPAGGSPTASGSSGPATTGSGAANLPAC